jgi:hypothetical protein
MVYGAYLLWGIGVPLAIFVIVIYFRVSSRGQAIVMLGWC